MFEPEILRWETPPLRQRAIGRVDWVPVAETLRQRSGDWALLAAFTGKQDTEKRRLTSLASNIRGGLIRAFSPKGSFEAVTRMVDDETRLYARHTASTREATG